MIKRERVRKKKKMSLSEIMVNFNYESTNRTKYECSSVPSVNKMVIRYQNRVQQITK